MKILSVRCDRCKRLWRERGFHVEHENEKDRTCPWPREADRGGRCDGPITIRMLPADMAGQR